MEHQNLHPECGQKVTDCPTVPLLWLFHQEGPHPQTMTPGEPFLNLEMLLLITGRQSSVDSSYMCSSKTQCEDIKKKCESKYPNS